MIRYIKLYAIENLPPSDHVVWASQTKDFTILGQHIVLNGYLTAPSKPQPCSAPQTDPREL